MKTYHLDLPDLMVRALSPNFLSFTIDISLVLGSRWWGSSKGTRQGLSKDKVAPLDLTNPELLQYAKLLSPGMLRIGGTEADRLHYYFSETGKEQQQLHLKKSLWKQCCHFAQAQGFQLLFTLGMGPESRDKHKNWMDAEALSLISYTLKKKLPVEAWELGNEVNAFPFFYGRKYRISSRRYAKEVTSFAQKAKLLDPNIKLIGPASAVWPIIGEPNPLIPGLCKKKVLQDMEALSIHYYPQQSSRGPVAVRRAKKNTLLSSHVLDGSRRWVRYVQKNLAKTGKSNCPLWITETGHALCGGEPGISDTWISSLWWMDQLGLMAYNGVETVFRQSLIGGDYGLLHEKDFTPRPDYYASFLWKKLIGAQVYEKPVITGPDRKLRAWRFSGKDQDSWLLVINLNTRKPIMVNLSKPFRRLLSLEPQSAKLPNQQILLNGIPVTPRLVLEWDNPEIQKLYRLEAFHRLAGTDESFQLKPYCFAFIGLDS